ncbi:D-tyrosyl-tRNA(Tyr) deacylase [Marinomonas agarivorans]|nr:D-tyrosyl-tRNA(Tyr) deacylase [Marinomonas agarivorans]
MKLLVQRVSKASVHVDGNLIGDIAQGQLVLVGIEKNDTEEDVTRLAEKLLNYRMFSDDNAKMNLNVQQVNGGILLVSQFTLAAETKKGLRPGFSTAAEPERAQVLFNLLVEHIRAKHPIVATGKFGADMQVSLINDGPVTFLLS